MKPKFAPSALKILRGAIVLVGLIVVAYVAYAAISISVNNTATVNVTGVNLFLATGQASTTVCSGTTTGYSESPSIAWGSVSQISTQDQYACLENIGSTSHTLVVTTSFNPAYGTLNIYSGGTGTTPLSGVSIPANSFILVHLNWVVSSTAPTGPTSFSVNLA